MNIYLLIPKGIGEQLPAGAFLSREDAEDAAERLWPYTDGYHDMTIREYEVGVVYDSFPRGWTKDLWILNKPTQDPLRLDFNDEPKRFEADC